MSTPTPRTGRRGKRLGRLLVGVLATSMWLAACSKTPEQMLASAKGYLGQNKPEAAAIELKNALQKDGALAEARFLLGKIHLEQGEAAAAAKELRRAADLGYPEVDTAPLLARALLLTGEADEVINKFADSKLSDPQAQAVLRTALGDAYLAKAQLDKARDAYSEAVAADPKNALARVGIARTRVLGGDIDGAIGEVDGVIADHPDTAEAYALKADLMWAKNRVDEATAALSAAVKAAPKNVAYNFRLVSFLLRQNKFDEAAARLADMQKVAPNHPTTTYLQAFLDFRNNHVEAARDGTMKVLKVAPEYLPAQLLAGAIFLRLNDQAQAQEYLGKVISRAPRIVLARRLMAQSLLASRQPAQALETLEPALQGAQEDPVILNLAGEVYLANGDLQHAAEYFGRVVKADPKDPAARTRLGIARLAKGDSERALADLEAASDMKGDSIQPEIALILAHLKLGELDKALEAERRLEQAQPNNAQAFNLKGGVLLAKRDLAGARAAFDKALVLDPASLSAVMNLVRLDVAEKHVDQAKQRFDAFIERNPKDVGALLAKADLLVATGGASTEVMPLLERAAKLSPGTLSPKLALVRQYLRDRQPAKALALAQEAAAAYPNDPQALEALARSQVAGGDNQQALSTFQKMAALQPRSARRLIELADAQAAVGDKAGAEQSVRKALSFNANLLDARQRLIALLMDGKRPDEALTVARELQRLSPTLATGYLFEGDIHTTAKAWDKAADAFRKALPLKESGPAPAKLYVVLMESGKAPDADKMAADWLAKHPKDLLLRSQVAQTAIATKRYRDADRVLRDMLKISPDNPLVLNNLAWVAGQLKDPGAIGYAESALAKAPDNPAILDTLGMLQVAGGEPERGIEHQRKAVSLAPKAPSLRLNLAKSYLQLQRKDEARKELDAVLAAVPAESAVHAEASRLRQGL